MSVVKYKGMEVDPTRLNESITIQLPSATRGSLKESFGQGETVSPRIEAIHAGSTKNHMYYPSEKLKGDKELGSGVYSWTSPYAKPVIYNHDTETEVTGRVERAAYADYTQAGRPGIILVPKITEPNAVKAIKDGRLLTVSIGGTTDAAICSVCGTDIINEGFCGHMKGEVHEGETVTWIAGNLWFDELSWVNVPADQDAMVVEVETNTLSHPTTEGKEVSEEKELTLNEFYNLPRTATILESVAKTAIEEGSETMSEKETITEEEIKDEEVLDTPEEDAVETEVVDKEEVLDEEEVKVAKEDDELIEVPSEEDSQPEVEEDEAETEVEIDVPEETKVKDATVEGPTTLVTEEATILRQEVEALTLQVSVLTEELRKEYEDKVLLALKLEDDAKDKFATRLETRSLASLKEMLDDINEGFYAVDVPEKKKESRKVTKVESPIKESKEKSPKNDNSDKVNLFASMFK